MFVQNVFRFHAVDRRKYVRPRLVTTIRSHVYLPYGARLKMVASRTIAFFVQIVMFRRNRARLVRFQRTRSALGIVRGGFFYFSLREDNGTILARFVSRSRRRRLEFFFHFRRLSKFFRSSRVFNTFRTYRLSYKREFDLKIDDNRYVEIRNATNSINLRAFDSSLPSHLFRSITVQ